MISMNVTDKEYGSLTPEAKELYDSIANYFLFESDMSDLANINFQDRISSIKNESDKKLLRDFLFTQNCE